MVSVVLLDGISWNVLQYLDFHNFMNSICKVDFKKSSKLRCDIPVEVAAYRKYFSHHHFLQLSLSLAGKHAQHLRPVKIPM